MLLYEELEERWLFLGAGVEATRGLVTENGVILCAFMDRIYEEGRSLHVACQPLSAPLSSFQNP